MMSNCIQNGKAKMPSRGGKKKPPTPRPINTPGASRRSWTAIEENVLIQALKEITATGWKGDNGFKTGYLLQLEKLMRIQLPGTDLKALPHINSKLHVWKKDYGTLFTMINTSGFAWNTVTKTINVDSDEVWEQYVQVDSNAKGMRYKAHPFYKDWEEVFGKDRATGEYAEDFYTATNEPIPEADNNEATTDFDWNGLGNLFPEGIDLNSAMGNPPPPMPPTQPSPAPTTNANSSGKKRKNLDGRSDAVAEILGNFCDSTKEALSTIAKRVGYEFDAAEARTKIYDELGKMPFLSVAEKVKAARLLIKDPNEVDLWFSLPDDAKMEMITAILADSA